MARFKQFDEVQCVKEIDNLIVRVRKGAIGRIETVRSDENYVVSFGMWNVGCNDSHLELIKAR